ncbi:MAG: NnrS family protein [Candidatus Rokubacteria bacterium]|nr:NnrS family protein [Candidatus Rokubacteria bacterium]
MSPAAGPPEPPLYRPFALLAFGATLCAGTPAGLWLLVWLYAGAPAAGPAWRLLHAEVQILGFFATLIPGVAQHLAARFTGRPVARHPLTRPLAPLLGLALALRVAGTALEAPAAILAGALVHAGAFALFACWVWRALDPPPLALLRRHLTLATAWLVLACAVEAWARAGAGGAPDPGVLRAAHAMALLGGVLGWVTGVLLRAGPMFIPHWAVPPALAHAVAPALAAGVVLTVVGEAGPWTAPLGPALARLGEFAALAALGALLAAGGAARRTRGSLPMLARSGPESRLFRLAAASAAAALAGAALATLGAALGAQVHVLADAARHLLTVGFLTSLVVAMTFRLIPALEQRALRWPGLRAVAFWALAVGIALRTAEALVPLGAPWLAPWVPLSGLAVWLALAGVALNLVGPRGR